MEEEENKYDDRMLAPVFKLQHFGWIRVFPFLELINVL